MATRSFKDNCLKACKEIIVLFPAGIVLRTTAAIVFPADDYTLQIKAPDLGNTSKTET
jgi:hypothetical protein